MDQTNNPESRFHAYKKDNTIQLFGAIGDTTSFNAITELLGPENYFDCSGLVSASWIGLLGFNRYIDEIKGKVILHSIPSHIYRFLRILPDCADKYSIESVNLEVYQLSDPAQVEDQTFQIKDLEDFHKNSGDFYRDGNKGISGNIPKLVPALFTQSDIPPKFKNQWCLENSEESFFFYNLLSFWASNLGLSLDISNSQRVGLALYLDRISVRINLVEAALSKVVAGLDTKMSNSLNKITVTTNQACQEISHNIAAALATTDQIIRNFEIYFEDSQNNDGGSKIFKHIDETVEQIKKLGKYCEIIEEVSFQSAQKILDLDAVQVFKSAMLKIDGSKLTPELLDKMRSALHIMDPFAEEDWNSTKEHINKELELVHQDIGNCVVIFQGFDLLRQIIEHRVTEGNLVKTFLPDLESRNKPWTEAQQEIFAAIKKSLVTDQEKYSYAFFLPKGYEIYKQEEESSKAPGDVMFF